MSDIVIFGAQSIALGTYKAVRHIYRDLKIVGFLVSSKSGNPDTLAGLPVHELGTFHEKRACVLIATPEDIQEEIVRILEEYEFHNHICIDSEKESALMEKYYTQIGAFRSLHRL